VTQDSSIHEGENYQHANNERVTSVDYISQITSNNQLMKTFYAHMPITCTVKLKYTTTTTNITTNNSSLNISIPGHSLGKPRGLDTVNSA